MPHIPPCLRSREGVPSVLLRGTCSRPSSRHDRRRESPDDHRPRPDRLLSHQDATAAAFQPRSRADRRRDGPTLRRTLVTAWLAEVTARTMTSSFEPDRASSSNKKHRHVSACLEDRSPHKADLASMKTTSLAPAPDPLLHSKSGSIDPEARARPRARYLDALRRHSLLVLALIGLRVATTAAYSVTACPGTEAKARKILMTPISSSNETFTGSNSCGRCREQERLAADRFLEAPRRRRTGRARLRLVRALTG